VALVLAVVPLTMLLLDVFQINVSQRGMTSTTSTTKPNVCDEAHSNRQAHAHPDDDCTTSITAVTILRQDITPSC
jgi:hypothetical protein